MSTTWRLERAYPLPISGVDRVGRGVSAVRGRDFIDSAPDEMSRDVPSHASHSQNFSSATCGMLESASTVKNFEGFKAG